MSNLTQLSSLNENLKLGLENYGIKEIPQTHSSLLSILTSGHDTIILGGEISCFQTNLTTYIAALNKIEIESNSIQLIVIKPTRELLRNSMLQFKEIAKFMGLNILEVYSQTIDVAELKLCQALFITPGRLIDLLRRHIITVTNLNQLIVDRVEDIYHRQSIEFIEEVFKLVDIKTQLILLFSSTVIDNNLNYLISIMKSPKYINIDVDDNDRNISSNITHYYINYEGCETKLDIIKELNNELEESCKWCIFSATAQEFTEIERVLEQMNTKFQLLKSSTNVVSNRISYLIVNNSEKLGIFSNFNNFNQPKLLFINYSIPAKLQYLSLLELLKLETPIIVINIIKNTDYNQLKSIENHYKIEINELPDNINALVGQ